MGEKPNLPAIPTRTVTVYSSQEGTAYEYETAVRTFGELKELTPSKIKSRTGGEQVGTRPISFSEKVVRVKETRVTLEIDSAMLPDGNCTIFTFPQKSKAGAYKSDEVDNLQYNPARSLGSSINKKFGAGIDLNVPKDQMKENIKDWMRENNKSIADVEKFVPEKKVRGGKRAEKPAAVRKELKEKLTPKSPRKSSSRPVQDKGSKGSVMDSLKAKAANSGTPHLTVLNQILAEQKQTNTLLSELLRVEHAAFKSVMEEKFDEAVGKLQETGETLSNVVESVAQHAEKREEQQEETTVGGINFAEYCQQFINNFGLEIANEATEFIKTSFDRGLEVEDAIEELTVVNNQKLEEKLQEEARKKEEEEERERKRKEDDERREREAEERRLEEERKARVKAELDELAGDIDDEMMQGTRGH